VTIENLADLQTRTIQQILDTDIVIVGSNIYQDSRYGYYGACIEEVAEVAGMIPFDEKASLRAKDSWYQAALKEIEGNLVLLQGNFSSNPKGFENHLNTQRRKAASLCCNASVKEVEFGEWSLGETSFMTDMSRRRKIRENLLDTVDSRVMAYYGLYFSLVIG